MRRRLTLSRARLAAALALLAGGCRPYARLTDVGYRAPRSAECGHCHVAVYAEWSRSRHATSWTNARFVRTTDDRAIEGCLGCHAPDSLYVQGPPRRRHAREEEGVSCVACHFDGEVLAGPEPTSALLDPHPIAAGRDLYLRSDLCGKCHEGTYREWQGVADVAKRTCQDCHMPRVTRTLTQATDALSEVLVAMETPREGRRHLFHADAVVGFEGAVETSVECGPSATDRAAAALVLVDRLPHRIPTGDFGSRPLVVEVDALDARGRALRTAHFELYRELGTALVPDEPRRLPLDLPAAAVALRVRLERPSDDAPPRLLHAEELRLP